ncbi:MAG TPA: chemotaxis protein CheW [Spirochaetia bacterium]|nr:chemotaxis protein CheW [Spirochaetia bacterium]
MCTLLTGKEAAEDGPAVKQVVLFRVGEIRCAVDLGCVERVLPAVELTVLPGAPPGVPGLISVEGVGIPVFDMRGHFGIPARDMRLDDCLVLAWAGSRRVAMWVDEAEGVIDLPTNAQHSDSGILPNLPEVRGIVSLPDGIVLIYNLEAFLSIDEKRSLDSAMQKKSCE